MRRPGRPSPLLVCFTVTLLLASAPAARTAPAPRTGTLRVSSRPYAQVFLEGQTIGVTPLKQTLRPGTYQLELRTPKGRSYYKRVTIRAGKGVTLLHKFGLLKRGGVGTLRVDSQPWAQVFIDGRAVGNTPLRGYRLTGRSYVVELRTTTGQSYKRILYVERGRTARVWHKFSKPDARQPRGPAGWLRVNSAPASTVYVDGKRAGQTPLNDYDLRVGIHVVKLVTADQRTHQRTIHIGRDKTTQFVYRFKARAVREARPNYGFIRIASNHQAEVFIDGKQVGWTPLIDHQLRPGRHSVLLKRHKRRKRYRIVIRKGFTRTISARFYR